MAGSLAGALGLAAGSTRASSALQAAQAAANSRPGARTTPARVLPVPDDLDAATRKLVEAPYSSFWNMKPRSDAAGREVSKRLALNVWMWARCRPAALRRKLADCRQSAYALEGETVAIAAVLPPPGDPAALLGRVEEVDSQIG